jgi:hypothetical protein
MAATYTHIGGLAIVGYQHYGKDFEHRDRKHGKRHALNREGYRKYKAICGEAVPLDSSDQFDQMGLNPICKAADGKITCKKCLAMKPVVGPMPTERWYRILFEANGIVKCWTSSFLRFDRHAIEKFEKHLADQGASRVWVEEFDKEITD